MKNRFTLLCFIILLPLTVCVLSHTANAATNAKIIGRDYVNNKYGFQISLPDSLTKWRLSTEEKMNAGIDTFITFYVIHGPARENINIIVDGTTNSLQNYLAENVAGCKLILPDWKELSRQIIAISEEKVKGYELISTSQWVVDGVKKEFTTIQWITIRGEFADRETLMDKCAYVITGVDISESFDLDVFRMIMSTFKFLPISVSEKRSTATTWGNIKSL